MAAEPAWAKGRCPAVPHIETPRLFIRDIAPDDFGFLAQLFQKPKVMQYYASGMRDAGSTRSWMDLTFENYRQYGHGKWLILRREDRQPIGHCGLVGLTFDGRPEIESGYCLDDAHWGKGYATEAALASMEYGFRKFGYKRIISAINPKNLPSIAVAERAGMERQELGIAEFGAHKWQAWCFAKKFA